MGMHNEEWLSAAVEAVPVRLYEGKALTVCAQQEASTELGEQVSERTGCSLRRKGSVGTDDCHGWSDMLIAGCRGVYGAWEARAFGGDTTGVIGGWGGGEGTRRTHNAQPSLHIHIYQTIYTYYIICIYIYI